MKQPRGFSGVLFLMYGGGLILLLLIMLVIFVSGGYSASGLQSLLLVGLVIGLGLLPFAYLFRGVRVTIICKHEEAFLTKLEDQLGAMNYGLHREEDEIRVYTPLGEGKYWIQYTFKSLEEWLPLQDQPCGSTNCKACLS